MCTTHLLWILRSAESLNFRVTIIFYCIFIIMLNTLCYFNAPLLVTDSYQYLIVLRACYIQHFFRACLKLLDNFKQALKYNLFRLLEAFIK